MSTSSGWIVGTATCCIFIWCGPSYTRADIVLFMEYFFQLAWEHDGHAAIDHEFSACDKTCLVTGDKGHEVCNLRRRADPLERLEAQNALLRRLGVGLHIKPLLNKIGAHPARTNSVDANIVLSVVKSQIPRHAHQRGLRCCVWEIA